MPEVQDAPWPCRAKENRALHPWTPDTSPNPDCSENSFMVAAFYLFALPCSWSERLCFNLSFRGRELDDPNLEAEEIYYLGCAVLPMGWSSAVGVMQYVAESVLLDAGLHSHSQIVRSSPLPEWMVKSLAEGSKTGQPWWHVYLDNYASGEKIKKDASPLGGKMQKKVATAWRKAGILTAEEKNLKDGKEATELGAYIGGEGQWLGASTERVFRTCKATCWVLRQQYLGRKTLQMLMGRWTFCMQFRRPFMSHFQATWEVLSRDRPRKAASDLCRDELVFAMYGSCLMHTWLGMKIDDQVMCSDASLSGGAVAIAKKLEPEGRAFLFSQQPSERAIPIPVLLISLFNGISGARRSYDVAGVEPRATVCVDMHKPANRVSSKRWPSSEFWLDIRNFTAEVIEEIIVRHEDCEEIHIWFGFPCVDLSSAKAYRKNLAGAGSSLIFEAQRVRKEVEKFARGKRVRFVAENVASMDKEAREEISRLLGVKPYRLDPANQVPMSRPRYCWTDIEIFETKEVTLIDKGDYIELSVPEEWPPSESWLEPGCEPFVSDVIYPCCMKSIPRISPPPQPAGLHRCDEETISRWQSDSYRFPPYQYKEQYLIWDPSIQAGRLLCSEERERLLGYGTNHTALAFSASEAKSRPGPLKDERNSLLGDSFSIYSFMIIAAFASFPWTHAIEISSMNNRTGLPPGYSLHLRHTWPLSATSQTPKELSMRGTLQELNQWLLRRTNHTGADVRLISGTLMNPRAFPRESVRSTWWEWQQLFTVQWDFEEHINPLETRAIFLSLLWRARNGCLTSRRIFNVTDSYVALSVLAKGRTSSKKLQPIVRKVCSMLLAAQAFLVLGHIDSADNPTDEGSREGQAEVKKSQKKAKKRRGAWRQWY